nr:hypothetical protein [Tanacetum cinerariifolium]
MQEVVLFYNGLDVPTRQFLDSRGAIPSKTIVDAKVAIQEMVEYSQKWHNGTLTTRSTKTSDGLAAIQAQLNNLGKEIKKVNETFYVAQAIYGRYMSKFMSESAKRHEENSNLTKEIRASTNVAIRNRGASIKTLEIQIGQMSKNRTLMYETKQTTIPFPSQLNVYYYEEKKGSYGPQFLKAHSEASHINNSIPRKEKDRGSFTIPCFINNVCINNALANLGASVSVMPLSTYLNLGLGELAHTKLTVELADRTVKYLKGIAKNMLVGIGKFIFAVDFIILDMPEDIKEGEVVKEFKAMNDARMVSNFFRYPSDCDHDKKIRIDCAYNLKFSCMIEDMDAYLDEGIGDVIFGEPFLREVEINAKRFEGMITIYNGNESVTY